MDSDIATETWALNTVHGVRLNACKCKHILFVNTPVLLTPLGCISTWLAYDLLINLGDEVRTANCCRYIILLVPGLYVFRLS